MTSGFDPDDDRADLGAIMGERRQLINVAYRLLGSLADAEDVVQETYARWYAMTPEQRGEIRAPGAWLTTVASRICLNLLGSARSGGRPMWANGFPSRCPTSPSGTTGPRTPQRSTRRTGSRWTSRSTWRSWWCWSR